jgi:hypothetical protein
MDFLWGFTAGVVLGIGLTHLKYYLESLAGDVVCDEWPRCWKRATHYLEIDKEPELDAGMCEHHANKKFVAALTDPDLADCDVNVYGLSVIMRRARIHRALNPFDKED